MQFREGALSSKDTTKINLYHTFGKTVYFCTVSHTKIYSPNLIRVHFVLKTLPKINMLSFSKTMHFYTCVYTSAHDKSIYMET